MITWIVLGSIGFMLLTSIYVGWRGSVQIDVMIEVKNLSNNWFHLGMSYNRVDNDECIQEELIVGLFFINFIVVFFKEFET
jgi:hypothetical protein